MVVMYGLLGRLVGWRFYFALGIKGVGKYLEGVWDLVRIFLLHGSGALFLSFSFVLFSLLLVYLGLEMAGVLMDGQYLDT